MAFQGMSYTLRQFRPLLIFEVDIRREQQFGDTPKKFLQQLNGLGYTLFAMRRNKLVPFDDKMINYDNVVGIPPQKVRT